MKSSRSLLESVRSWRGVFFAGALVALSVSAYAQEAAPPTSTLILFDASGSMWGKITGSRDPKFKLAGDALRAALEEKQDAAGQTGLIVFGAQCGRAPLSVAPGADSVAQIGEKLAGLNPKGKGPITLALETAAAKLAAGGAGAVILIHDGPDNCRRDPCEAAQSFAKTHKGVPVHLVSIGLTKSARIATACVAKLTGGTVAQVEDAQGLDAAVRAAVDLAMRTPEKPAADPATATSDPGVADEDDAADRTGPSRLRLSAALGADGDALKVPVRWQIFGPNREKDGALIDIAEPQFMMPLAAGPYTVVASIGQLTQSQTVDVAAEGATKLRVVFDAGRMRLSAPALRQEVASQGSADAASTIVTLHSLSQGADGAANKENLSAPLIVAAGGESNVILPSGTYRITMQAGRARSEREVTVTTGQTVDVDLDMGTGALRLGIDSNNADILSAGVLYKVFVDDPDAPSGRREVVRSTAQHPSFVLPAGTYYVSAQVGLTEAKKRLAVVSGTVHTETLELPAAQLSVETNLDISGQQSNLPVQYRIIRTGKAEREIAQSGKRAPTFVVSPGRYRIVAEIGARNVTATAEVDLQADTNTTVKLNPRAGAVALTLGGQTGAATVNRFWVVKDQLGNVVLRSNAYTPSALLAPGVYEVTCETRNGEVKRTFELAAGEDKSVELLSR